jgi:hypothetical protein
MFREEESQSRSSDKEFEDGSGEESQPASSDEEIEYLGATEESQHTLRDIEIEYPFPWEIEESQSQSASSDEESECWWNTAGFQYIGISFLEILELMRPPDTLELSHAFHILARSLVKFTDAFATAEAMYLRAIEQIERNLGAYAFEAEIVRQDLAMLYVQKLLNGNRQWKFDPIQSWEKQEQLIQTVLDIMERSLGENHQDVFKFLHRLGNRYMDAGMEEDAEVVFNEEWARKGKFLGPYHISTLKAVNSLQNLYLGQERYLEVDSLLRASLNPTKVRPTSRASDASTFWRWYERDRGLQGQLAKLKVPGDSLYWEDSRMYLKEIKDVNLVPVSPPDPFPPLPIRIIVSGNQLEVEISRMYAQSTGKMMGFEAEDQIVSYLQMTDIWRFLSSMASMLAWSQFQVDSFRIISEAFRPEWREKSEPDPDLEKPIPKTFWVFLEDQTPVLKENAMVSTQSQS